MDPAVLAARIEAERDRFAGTDAERRAAGHCAAALRDIGRAPRAQTLWFRVQRDAPRALHALLGIAGSVASVRHHPAGLALAGGALALSLLEAAGLPLAALPFPRRATQNVLAAPIDDPPGFVRLVLTAAADEPRSSILGRIAARTHGALVPGPAGLLDVALLAVAACAGARVAGAGGTALGVVQLIPTAVLILLLGGWIEAAMSSRPMCGANGAGPAVAIAVAAALDARPPRRLSVEVLIAGAGAAGAPGMRAFVRSRRGQVAPEDIVVLHLVGAPGPVRFMAREGERFPMRLHPRLTELAAELPGARRAETREVSGARVARGARWPAMTLAGPPADLAVAALRLIAAIDGEIRKGPRTQRR